MPVPDDELLARAAAAGIVLPVVAEFNAIRKSNSQPVIASDLQRDLLTGRCPCACGTRSTESRLAALEAEPAKRDAALAAWEENLTWREQRCVALEQHLRDREVKQDDRAAKHDQRAAGLDEQVARQGGNVIQVVSLRVSIINMVLAATGPLPALLTAAAHVFAGLFS